MPLVDAFDGRVGDMIEVPTDEFGFVCIGLFFDGIVEDKHRFFRLDGS